MRMKRILALCMAALMCAPCANAELKKGDRGGSVLLVQEELHARGYLTEEGDGLYGQMTANAVKAFQQANEIEPTGIVDDITYEKLMNDSEAQARRISATLLSLGYIDESEEASVTFTRFQRANGLEITGIPDEATVALIESGKGLSETAAMQQRLIDLGYLSGKADGNFGPMSVTALTHFQQEHDLEATGVADNSTLEMLFSDGVGNAVRLMQKRLIDLGYLSGKVDGDFGPMSIAALKQFQQAHGLEATGEEDDATREMLFSDDAKPLYPILNSASENVDAVKRLQQKLIDLGYLSGKADGDYGPKTYNAVLAFEKRLAAQNFDIAADGEADHLMQEILFGDDYTTYLEDISVGSEGDEAKRIENRLVVLGYMDAAADTIFDDYAAQCLSAFQTAAGLEPTGTADRASVDALFASDALPAKNFVLRDVQLGETSSVMRQAQEVLIRMGFLDQYVGMASGTYDEATEAALEHLHLYLSELNPRYAELFATKGTFTVNAARTLLEKDLYAYVGIIDSEAETAAIERLQRRLRGLFFDVDVTGEYDSDTLTAMVMFQARNDLSPTGIADWATQSLLFSDRAVGNWTQYMLKVSIDDQRVYIYSLDKNQRYQLTDTFICSSGLETTPETATPRGVFMQNTEPLDRWHYFTEYECWAQYAWRIEGMIYFHSVIYDEKDESTLRLNSLYNLGRKASHGCIRLSVEDAKWIYTNCDAGTIVMIY